MKIMHNIGILAVAGITSICASCGALAQTPKKNNIDAKRYALEQFQEDSAYYAKILYQSQAANDSNAVAEFNKIAASMRNIKGGTKKNVQKEILQNARENGVNEREEGIIKEFQYTSTKFSVKMKQRFADFFVFEKFLTRHNITERMPDNSQKYE